MREFFFKLLSIIKPTSFWNKPLPKSYSGLKLTKSLSHPQAYFGTGLYANRQGKKFVVKFWSGSFPNACYYILYREISFLKFVKQNLPLGKISFPEFVESYVSPKDLVLITKYFPPTANGNYFEVVKFLRRLPTNLPIPERTSWYFILLFPIIWMISVFRHWNLLPLLIKSWIVFWLNSPSLFHPYKQVFVHGDLHPDNLLTDGQKILILDLGQAMYTYPEFEVATTLTTPNLAPSLKKRLLNSIPSNRWSPFSIMGIFCVTYHLTGRSSIQREKSFITLLNICTRST